MAYGIRLANGEVQPVTESRALTNEQVDGLLGGGAELVWIDAEGIASRLDILQMDVSDQRRDENAHATISNLHQAKRV
jgi:hypothetical protein